MVLEAIVICVDNSGFSRNGDYVPTRLDAQREAANLIGGSRINQNPENTVGLLTTAGFRVEVHVTPTYDLGKLLQGLHNISIQEFGADVVRALHTAQLALKHRINKNQRQRIILFVGSPVTASERQLEQLGRILKKNNVSLDIISFGETAENSLKLRKLFEAVNNNMTSNLVECPCDTSRVLSDFLRGTPVVLGQGRTREGGEGGEDDLGVDPSVDPELYAALRLSLQEEQNRQARIAAAAAVSQQGAAESTPAEVASRVAPIVDSGEPSSAGIPPATTATDAVVPAGAVPASGPATSVSTEPQSTEQSLQDLVLQDLDPMDSMDEDLRRALLLSLVDYEQSIRINTTSSSAELPARDVSYDMTSAGGDASILPPQEASAPIGSASAKFATAEEVAAAAATVSSQPSLLLSSGNSGNNNIGSTAAPSGTPSSIPASLIQELVSDLPGVDLRDPRLLEALSQATGGSETTGPQEATCPAVEVEGATGQGATSGRERSDENRSQERASTEKTPGDAQGGAGKEQNGTTDA